MNQILIKNESENETIKSYYEKIKKNPVLSFEEEQELARQIKQGDQDARTRLIESNLRLVYKIARIYKTQDIPLLDLIQDGNVGLIKAVERFDFTRNIRFATYAYIWIKQSISDSVMKNRRSIRLPVRKVQQLKKLNRTTDNLTQELLRKPEDHEIALKSGVSENEIKKARLSNHPIVSFEDKTANENNSIQPYEDNTYNPYRIFIEKCLKQETIELVNRLKDSEKHIVLNRFFNRNHKKTTFKVIGRELGVSGETARKMESRALSHLKEMAIAVGVDEYYYTEK